MKSSSLFTPSFGEIEQMISEHPFALLVSTSPQGLLATPLPLLLEHASDGGLQLLGHFSRANPQAAAFEHSPEALIVFQGPHGYISPSWFEDRTQAPTWNYATVHFSVRIELLPSRADAEWAVTKLTAVMEAGRPNAWKPTDMGTRFEKLLPAIVPFRATVLETNAKFKLGQNERSDVLHESLVGLENEGQMALATMMRDKNVGRLG